MPDEVVPIIERLSEAIEHHKDAVAVLEGARARVVMTAERIV